MNAATGLAGFGGSRATATAFLLSAAVGWVDYATGHEYSVSILYLVPVFIAAWFAGKGAGVAAAFVCAGVWLVAELMSRKYADDPLVLYWNDIMELGFFLVVAYSLSALKSALEHEKLSARTDALTGVANRRAFYDLAEIEINRLHRYGHPFTVGYIDIDNFKQINDTLGHGEGDTLLRVIAESIRNTVRKTDIVGRLGGDEFALLMPETGADAALNVVGKVRTLRGIALERGLTITLSIGIVVYLSPPESVEEMIKRADALMYSVKTGGKDSIKYEIVGRAEIDAREQ